jgi:hypothetical protein
MKQTRDRHQKNDLAKSAQLPPRPLDRAIARALNHPPLVQPREDATTSPRSSPDPQDPPDIDIDPSDDLNDGPNTSSGTTAVVSHPSSPSDPNDDFAPDLDDDRLALGSTSSPSSPNANPNDHNPNSLKALRAQAIKPPLAWKEPPAVRWAYLKAVIGNAFHNQPIPQATTVLNDLIKMRDMTLKDAAIASGNAPPPKPAITPAKTLETAKRRLGLDADLFIEKIPICSVCFKNYTNAEIEQLPSPSCTVRHCKGLVYTEKLVDSKQKRVPVKIFPAVPVIPQLRHLFMQPGFADSLHDSSQCVDQTDDPKHKMRDIYDGVMWTRSELGLRCTVIAGKVVDSAVTPGSQRPFHKTKYAIRMTFNMDW